MHELGAFFGPLPRDYATPRLLAPLTLGAMPCHQAPLLESVLSEVRPLVQRREGVFGSAVTCTDFVGMNRACADGQ